MSWLNVNLNDSLNSLKGQISSFANNVLAEDEDSSANGFIGEDVEKLKELCSKQQEEIQHLRLLNQKVNNATIESSDANWDWSLSEKSPNKAENETITNLKQKIAELESEKRELVENIELLDSDFQQNTEKLALQKNHVQTELNELEEKYTTLEEQNKKLIKELLLQKHNQENNINNTNKLEPCIKCEKFIKSNLEFHKQIEKLQAELALLTSNNDTLTKTLQETKNLSLDGDDKLKAELAKAYQTVKEYQTKHELDGKNCNKLGIILEGYEQQVSNLKQELLDQKSIENELKIQLQNEKDKTHAKYINILTENVKKYADSTEISNFEFQDTDPQICEFNNQVGSILNLLFDLKVKNQSLEQDLYTVQNEKTDLLTEKNYEIEKLLKNSEILSQEVITKSQTIKDYESECNDLIKNNDIMIAELEGYKNASGLQTISESNEDNLLQLESQLEIASKRIEELENGGLDPNQELETLKCQNRDLHQKLQDLETKYKDDLQEKITVLARFEKLKADLENTEYQYSEINVMMDAMREEIENQRKKVKELMVENANLKKVILELERNGEDVRGELNSYREQLLLSEDNSKQLQNQVNKLDEKLQNAKMYETTLKLQFDTMSKELGSLHTAKNGLEMSLQSTLESLGQCEERFKILQAENEELTKISEYYKAEITKLTANQQLIEVKLKTSEESLNVNELGFNLEKEKDELDENLQVVKQERDELKQQLFDSQNELVKLRSEEKVKMNSQEERFMILQAENENFAKVCESQKAEIIELTANQQFEEVKLKTSRDALNLEMEKEKLDEDLQLVRKERDELKQQLSDIQNELGKLREEKKVIMDFQEDRFKILQIENEKLAKIGESYRAKIAELTVNQQFEEVKLKTNEETLNVNELVFNLESEKDETNNELQIARHERDELKKQLSDLENELVKQRDEEEANTKMQEVIGNLQQQIDELTKAKTELTTIIGSKHQENVTYYNELQRLGQMLNQELEKLRQLEAKNTEVTIQSEKLNDQNQFLREKCEIITGNLLSEQARVQQLLAENAQPSEKEHSLNKTLERLQHHLIEVEEHYTQELLRAEEKNRELEEKMNEIEEREKNSSTMYTSVSIRANQHVETLQNQLQLITNQRDVLRKRISDAEDNSNRQAAALANLQLVLEQFQKDKENDILKETERIRRQISAEKLIQNELRTQIGNLEMQIDDSKQGLQAASRLSDQLEHSKQLITTLKGEVAQLKEKVEKGEQQLRSLSNQTDGKVDKSLIKNLIIGFVTTNNNLNKDQSQILKIIATVLDFNQQDHDKLSLTKQHPWLSFLSPQNESNESLSQAFVKFLETESKPRSLPSLLSNEGGGESTRGASRKSSTVSNNDVSTESSTARASPIVLSEVVLPSFADFAQSRNSSAILKDVLHDNS